MQKIIRLMTIIAALGTPILALAHVGPVASDAVQHGALHLTEIAIALFVVCLGFRVWRGRAKSK